MASKQLFLFERLESYSRENFTTEILAYLLQTDSNVRHSFLKLLLKQRPKILKSFEKCDVATQVSHTVGRPDLELTDKVSGMTIRVEVKTQSQEGDGQLQKYLTLPGYVAYLTPLGFDAPENVNDNFLGHIFWHEVFEAIRNSSQKSAIHKQFLGYLEARDMGLPKPINDNELKSATYAVDLIRKSQALVDDVRKRVEKDWYGSFGKNAGAKGVLDGLADGALPYWWYQAKHWKKPGRGFYLCLGVCEANQSQNGALFYLNIGSSQKIFGRGLEDDIKLAKKLRKLCTEYHWEADNEVSAWGYSTYFTLHCGVIENIAAEQAKRVLHATKELQKLQIIKLIEDRI